MTERFKTCSECQGRGGWIEKDLILLTEKIVSCSACDGTGSSFDVQDYNQESYNQDWANYHRTDFKDGGRNGFY